MLRKPAGAGPVPDSRRAMAWMLGGHLLAMAWCLPLIAPFLDLVNRTDRYDGTAWESQAPASPEEASRRGGFSFEKFSTGALRPVHLSSLIIPHALGTPSNGSWWGGEVWGEVFLYIGGLGLFFCRFASPRRAGADLRWLWGIGLFGLWLSFGPRMGASQIQYHIPLFNDFRRPARFLILFVMALAALSGHGFQRWAARPSRGKAWAWAAAAIALALAAASLRFHAPAFAWMAEAAQRFDHLDAGKDYSDKIRLLLGRYALYFAMAGLSAAAVWLFARRGRKALPALFLVLLLDLLRLHWDHFYLFPASYYRKPPPSVAVLDASTRPFWRVNHYLEYPGDQMWEMHNDPIAHFPLLEREKTALTCGIHAVFGYRHVSAHLPLLWKWEDSPTPGQKAGRYLFSNRVLSGFRGDSLARLAGFGEVIAYEVKGWRPRLESLPKRMVPAGETQCEAGFFGYGDLCAREPRDGYLLLRGEWKAGDTLLFREHFDAGWRYRLDGGNWRPAHEAPDHFMALALDRDAAGMEIEYHPGGFYRWAGLVYGLTALAGLLGLLLRVPFFRSREPAPIG